jgi:regulation of enolase protein 1 (concanavalin A-like superfamily)
MSHVKGTPRLNVPSLALAALVVVYLLAAAPMGETTAAKPGGGESPQKVEGWGEFVDASGQCKVRLEGTRVMIETPAGSFDLWPEGKRTNAPRLVQDASGDFTVRVKTVGNVMGEKGAEATGRDVAFNAATLVIWQDENNFVRLDRAGMHKAGTRYHQTYYHINQDGKRTVQLSQGLPEEDSWLQLQRRGSKITAGWSVDGTTWKTYPVQDAKLADKVKVGVAALNSGTKPFVATFEDLKLTPAEKDR